MTTLYELSEEQRLLKDQLFFLAESDDPEDIEYTEYLSEYLEKINDSAENKIGFLCSLYLELDATYEQRQQIARKAAARAKTAQNLAGAMRDKIMNYMQVFDIKKVECRYANASRYQIDELVIDPMATLHEDYLRFKAPEPKRDDIKRALKKGEIIEGCTLVKKDALRIS